MRTSAVNLLSFLLVTMTMAGAASAWQAPPEGGPQAVSPVEAEKPAEPGRVSLQDPQVKPVRYQELLPGDEGSQFSAPGGEETPAGGNEAPGSVVVGPAPANNAGTVSLSDDVYDSDAGSRFGYRFTDPFGPLFRVDRRVGDGTGYDSDYTNINVFMPLFSEGGQNMLFWNALASVDDTGLATGNIGGGFRRYSPAFNRINGASIWLDVDEKDSGTFIKTGFVLESLGQYFDARLSGDLALADNEEISSTIIGNPFFQGNNILFNRRNVTEYAYSHVDAEVGGPLPFVGNQGINGYVGAYAQRSDEDSSIGWKARLEAYVTEDLTLSAQVSDDDTFGTNAFMSLVFTFPQGGIIPERFFKAKSIKERMGTPVVRDYRVRTRIETETVQEVAINQATGDPFFVLIVDPDDLDNPATHAGTGSFEDPFTSLGNFVNNPNADIIFVRSRDDNTGIRLVSNGTVELFDNQRFLGQGTAHTISTTQGAFLLPEFVTPPAGQTGPIISNGNTVFAPGNTSVVQVANNNEISGFVIDGSGNLDGVSNLDTVGLIPGVNPINGINLNNNIIQNGRHGVFLQDLRGTAVVSNNTFQTNFLDGFNVTNNSPGAGTLNIQMLGNNAVGNTRNGYFLSAQNANNTINVIFRNNTTFLRETVDANNNGVLDIIADSGNSGNGAMFQTGNVFLGGPNGGTINVVGFTGNNLSENDLSGLELTNVEAGGVINAQIGTTGQALNTFDGNGDSGMRILNQPGATVNVAVQNNLFGNLDTTARNGNENYGLFILNNEDTVGGLTTNFNVLVGGPTLADGNIFSGNNVGLGAYFSDTGFGQAARPTFVVQNNTVQNNGDRGILMALSGGANTNALITLNTVTTNGADVVDGGGILVQGLDFSGTVLAASPDATVSFNNVNNNNGDGITLIGEDNSTILANVVSNNITGNTDDGVQVHVQEDARATFNVGTVGQGNVITGNLSMGVDIQSSDLANRGTNTNDSTVNVVGNLISNNAAGGVNFEGFASNNDTNPNSSTPDSGLVANGNINILSNTISGNGPFGIRLVTLGRFGDDDVDGNFLEIVVANNTIFDHTGDGIFAAFSADRHQQRRFLQPNGPSDVPVPPGDPDPGPPEGSGPPIVAYSPSSTNPNSLFFNAARYRENYLNVDVESSVYLIVDSNSVFNNTGDGLELAVATNTLVNAMVNNNNFSGNTASSVNIRAFLAGGIQTNDGINRSRTAAQPLNFDEIFLDDTAQLNLRFTNNIGNVLLADASGATYTGNGTLKNFDGAGGFDANNRLAGLFAVDTRGELNVSNIFQTPGLGQQDIEATFFAGAFVRRNLTAFPFPDFDFADPDQGGLGPSYPEFLPTATNLP